MKINEKDIDKIGEFAMALSRGLNELDADSCSVNIELNKKFITLSLRVIDCNDIECRKEAAEDE